MQVSFHGAAREVTGSCALFSCSDAEGKEHRVLVDCGMFQGEVIDEERNHEPFGFDPATIEAVFITHPHADHTGRLPKLVAEGFAGKIYMTEPCQALTKLILEDALHLMKLQHEEAKHEPSYTEKDLKKALKLMHSVGYHEEVMIANGVRVMFHNAGHVLGSAYISIEAEGKRVIFSGDVGNEHVPILPETEAISSANIVVCESTYGHRIHEPMEKRRALLKEALVQTIAERGVLLIPAFSIERTQELLYEFNQILRNELKTSIPIFLDSPLSIKATQTYRDYKQYLHFETSILSDPDRDFFSFPNLRETLTRDESKSINETPFPKVIIAGSGMMNGGRIRHHLRRYLGLKNTTVLIIGYQSRGTLGRALYEGAKKVHILGDEIYVNATIKAIGAFSAHADMNKLTRWLHPEDGKAPERIFLVHGETDVQDVFATHLRHELKSDVICAERGTVYRLTNT